MMLEFVFYIECTLILPVIKLFVDDTHWMVNE